MATLKDRAKKAWRDHVISEVDEIRYLWQPFEDLTPEEQKEELEDRLKHENITKKDAKAQYNYEHWRDFMVELHAACPDEVTAWAVGFEGFGAEADIVKGSIADLINDMTYGHPYPVILEGKSPGCTLIVAYNPTSKTSPVRFLEFKDSDPAVAFINPYEGN